MRIRHYDSIHVDAEVERLLDEDPSIDEGFMGQAILRKQALLRLLGDDLEQLETSEIGSAEAAHTEIYFPVGCRVTIDADRRDGTVCRTSVEVGVRVYDVQVDDGELVRGVLFKEITKA